MGVVKHKGYSISADFAGIGKPDRFVVRRLSASGVVGEALLGDNYLSVDEAMAAIDAICAHTMLTASTITDAQIRELMAEKCRCCDGVGPHWSLCVDALNEAFTFQRTARGYVAEILNARATKAVR